VFREFQRNASGGLKYGPQIVERQLLTSRIWRRPEEPVLDPNFLESIKIPLFREHICEPHHPEQVKLFSAAAFVLIVQRKPFPKLLEIRQIRAKGPEPFPSFSKTLFLRSRQPFASEFDTTPGNQSRDSRFVHD
jgi:hypothetical protein